MLVNLIFFVPKRRISIEFEDLTEELKIHAGNDRHDFNTYLEKFYNKEGEEKLNFLRHYFYGCNLKRKLPEIIKGSVADSHRKQESQLKCSTF